MEKVPSRSVEESQRDSIECLHAKILGLEEKLRATEKLNAGYLSELRDYGETVARLRRELAEAKRERTQ
jgi:hypothetical protein